MLPLLRLDFWEGIRHLHKLVVDIENKIDLPGLLSSKTMKFSLIGNKSYVSKVLILNHNCHKQELYIVTQNI